MIASCMRLVGEAVVDRHGEDVGRVDRVLIELASGRVAGVVVASGGVFGLGERQYEVAWHELRLDASRRRVVIVRRPEEAAAESPLSTL
jgi:sporulation protein YlmC with PRC-barrel domain